MTSDIVKTHSESESIIHHPTHRIVHTTTLLYQSCSTGWNEKQLNESPWGIDPTTHRAMRERFTMKLFIYLFIYLWRILSIFISGFIDVGNMVTIKSIIFWSSERTDLRSTAPHLGVYIAGETSKNIELNI